MFENIETPIKLAKWALATGKGFNKKQKTFSNKYLA